MARLTSEDIEIRKTGPAGDLGRRPIEVRTPRGVFNGYTHDNGSRRIGCWLWWAEVNMDGARVHGNGDTMAEAFDELTLAILRHERKHAA